VIRDGKSSHTFEQEAAEKFFSVLSGFLLFKLLKGIEKIWRVDAVFGSVNVF
jgi:hypothetical protein